MSLVQDAIMSQMAASEPWCNDAQLFKPDEENQILINENAACIAVQAYLKMCDLNVKVVSQSNAEHMCPSGQLPVLLCGNFVISEPLPIFKFVKQKGIVLHPDLTEGEQQDLKAYVELVNNTLVPAELFITWSHDDTVKEITKKRYGHPYPWPLNHVLSWYKQQSVNTFLGAIGWSKSSMSLTTVNEDVQLFCEAMSRKLGNKQYFFGNRPTELDALVFGHLFTIITTTLPDNRLAKTVQQFENLVAFCQKIERRFFKEGKGDENGDLE